MDLTDIILYSGLTLAILLIFLAGCMQLYESAIKTKLDRPTCIAAVAGIIASISIGLSIVVLWIEKIWPHI